MSEADKFEISAIESLPEPRRLWQETEPIRAHYWGKGKEGSTANKSSPTVRPRSLKNTSRPASLRASARTKPLGAEKVRNALSALHGGTRQKHADGTSHQERNHLWWVSGGLSTFAAVVLLGPMFAGIAFVGAAFFTDIALRELTDSEEVTP